ncbi:MAG TPA: 16S rRNA (guanine(527)-N(7))-methyltransferase RsmG [Candidatus Kapabacteria bacterium]|nr:16S rRNA (guanine(527)-N(7))-methyltransferase RsmG [Candidatus Kapabacteria bacterium]
MQINEFVEICEENDIYLNTQQIGQIEIYTDELKRWNKYVNLISRKDIDNILDKHILHSLSILKYVPIFDNAICLDIGSGGGLPGIPLKIAKPNMKLIMIDSIAKKINIIKQIVEKLDLKNVELINDRVENLAKNKTYANSIDYVIARAVASTDLILKWSIPLIKNNGKIVLLKGGDLSKEIADANRIAKSIKIEEIPIKLKGFDYFEREKKKLIIIRRD